MIARLMPYGAAGQAGTLSKVGKKQTPLSLAELMPSADIAAKVGSGGAVGLSRAGLAVRRIARG